MKPQFTPTQGIGSTYKDPRSGQTYTYTAQGWQLKSSNIQQETSESDTFEIKPDEKYFAERARANGASEDEIRRGILQDRQVRSNITSNGGTIGEEPQTTPDTTDTTNPFFDKTRGRILTKKEALVDAYNQGITDPDEISKVESLYDSLVGEDELGDFDQIDISALPPEEQALAKEQVKQAAVARAQELGSASEREGVVGAIAAMEDGQEIINLITGEDAVSTGIGSGLYRRGLSVFGVNVIPGARRLEATTEKEDELATKMGLFTANFIKAISGAQVSDKEREELMKILPSEGKGEQENIENIKALSDALANKYSPMVNVDLDPLKPGVQTEEDPLGINTNSVNPLGI